MATEELEKLIRNKLNEISLTFFEPLKADSPFYGKDIGKNLNDKPNDDDYPFYFIFKENYNNALTKIINTSGLATFNIYISTMNNNNAKNFNVNFNDIYRDTVVDGGLDNNERSYNEIFFPFLNNGFGKRVSSILNCESDISINKYIEFKSLAIEKKVGLMMKNCLILYKLFDPLNYDDYYNKIKDGSDQIFTIGPNNQNTKIFDEYTVKYNDLLSAFAMINEEGNDVLKIFTDFYNKYGNSLLIFRKLFILYYRVCQLYILRNLLQYYTERNDKDNITSANKLLTAVRYTIDYDNELMKLNIAGAIGKGINNRILETENYTKILTNVDKKLRGYKQNINDNKTLITEAYERSKRTRLFEYFSLFVLIYVVGSIIALFTLPSMNVLKMRIAGIALLLSVINAALMYVLYGYVVENFEDEKDKRNGNDKEDSGKDKGMGKGNKKDLDEPVTTPNAMIDNTQLIDGLKSSYEYLSTIQSLSSSIKSYQSLSTIASSTQKQMKFFVDTNEIANNLTSKMSNITGIAETTIKIGYAKMNLYIYTSIVTSLILLAYVFTDGLVIIQQLLVYIGGFILFATLMIFILQIVSIVRTDGTKYYWNKPMTRI